MTESAPEPLVGDSDRDFGHATRVDERALTVVMHVIGPAEVRGIW